MVAKRVVEAAPLARQNRSRGREGYACGESETSE